MSRLIIFSKCGGGKGIREFLLFMKILSLKYLRYFMLFHSFDINSGFFFAEVFKTLYVDIYVFELF